MPYKRIPADESDGDDGHVYTSATRERVLFDQRISWQQKRTINVLVLVCIALSAFCALLLVNTLQMASQKRSKIEITGLVPPIPLETYTFDAIERTTDATPSTLPRYDWPALEQLTRTYGLIHLSNATATAHHIAPSAWGGDRYSTSMMHQLHCLILLKAAIDRLEPPGHHDGAAATHAHAEHATAKHLNHCLDFLRQGIMCAGDLSIEVPRPTTNRLAMPNFFVNGWGTTHVCRSWGKMLEWMEGYHGSEV